MSDGKPARVMPGTVPRNGMPAAGGYVYGGTGEDTLTPPAVLLAWERDGRVTAPRERAAPAPLTPAAKLAARPRCPECRELAPNHRVTCSRIPVPDPDAERHSCGYVTGSLGCRVTCGGGT